MSAVRRNVGILIFDDVEILDFCGPFEVFATADEEGGEADRSLFSVMTIAEEDRTFRCRGGLLVQPNHTFSDHPKLDIIVVPGGYGTRAQVSNPRVLQWIRNQHASDVVTTSVCTGSFLLAETGLLDGLRATTHWGSIERMRARYPAVTVVDNERVIDQAQIVTSAGVSAGIDMALTMVERLHGIGVARATSRDMEYDWRR